MSLHPDPKFPEIVVEIPVQYEGANIHWIIGEVSDAMRRKRIADDDIKAMKDLALLAADLDAVIFAVSSFVTVIKR